MKTKVFDKQIRLQGRKILSEYYTVVYSMFNYNDKKFSNLIGYQMS